MPFPDAFYRWRPHPWHGLSAGEDAPEIVNAYIEITPYDPVKYETDKKTGYLMVDRPQRASSLQPSLYGFVPRTYCGKRTARLMEREGLKGDKEARELTDLPSVLIERLDHYFKTYKMLPGKECKVEIGKAYGREHAQKVVKASMEDYQERYGD